MKDFPNKMEIASSVSFKDVDNRNVITTVEQVKIERIELHFELILIDMEDNDQWQIKSKGISQLTFNDLLALTEIEHKTSNIENKRIFEKERKFNMSFLLHLRFFLFFELFTSSIILSLSDFYLCRYLFKMKISSME